jgi:transcriptional regulator with XRE-family HTH domain
MTSEHVRAARMLLRWEQKELAAKSGVSLPTIKRLEARPGVLNAYPDTIATIRKTFEDEGIEFFNGSAPGARLHRASASASKPMSVNRRVPPKKRRSSPDYNRGGIRGVKPKNKP